MVPDAQQADEAKDHKFGSYCFEELEPAKTLETAATEVIEPQVEAGGTVDCSQKSRKLSRRNEGNDEARKSFKERTKTQAESSKFIEYSQNWRILNKVSIFELKYDEQPLKKSGLLDISEFSEHSQNSQTALLRQNNRT